MRAMRTWAALLVLFMLCGCARGESAEAQPSDLTAAQAEPAPAPPEAAPENENDAEVQSTAEQVEGQALTLSEAMQFFKSLSPQTLGLEGDDMSHYRVYPHDGVVLVDGVACTEVFVYKAGENTGTNGFEGIYLLARDKSRLYSLDRGTDRVNELALPQEGSLK